MLVGINIQKMLDESATDPPALTILATANAKAWCERLGGWPSESVERMEQIWGARPEARKQMAAIMAMPLVDRRLLASYIGRRTTDPAAR